VNGGSLVVGNLTGNVNTARADGAGSSLTLGGEYVNNLSLDITNGASLTLNGDWDNTGVINIDPGGELNLGGQFTLGNLGTINNTGATTNVTGTLDLTGDTLTLSLATRTWNLGGGTINGGVVDVSGFPLRTVAGTSSTLLQTTVNGDLEVIDSELTVTGATLNGNTVATDATLTFGGLWSNNGTVTAQDSTIALGGTFLGSSVSGFARTNSPIELTGVMDNAGNTLALDPASGGFILDGGRINGGVIDATAAPLTTSRQDGVLDGVNLLGDFSIQFGDVDTFDLVNDGHIVVGTGSTLTLDGAWVNNGLIEALNFANAARIRLGGMFTTAELANIQNNRHTVEVIGMEIAGRSTVVVRFWVARSSLIPAVA